MSRRSFSSVAALGFAAVFGVVGAGRCLGRDLSSWRVPDGWAKTAETSFGATGLCVRLDRAKLSKPDASWVGLVPGGLRRNRRRRRLEDDGEGPDGYLMLTDDDEPMKQLKF